MKLLALIAILSFLPINTFAVFLDGNELHKYLSKCIGPDSSSSLCPAAEGYILGKYDTLKLIEAVDPDVADVSNCIPAVSRTQLRDVVARHLEDKPANRHLDAPILVFNALKNAWPCTGN